jgi:hypothetical protein
MYGRCYFQPYPTKETLRQAWREHGDEILAEWRETRPPGSRPFGWWLFVGVPKYGERPTTRAWLPDHEKYRANHEKYGVLDSHYWPPCQECEHRFLWRHGEITVGEFEAAEAISTFDGDLAEYDRIMADKKPLPPDTPDPFCVEDIFTL